MVSPVAVTYSLGPVLSPRIPGRYRGNRYCRTGLLRWNKSLAAVKYLLSNQYQAGAASKRASSPAVGTTMMESVSMRNALVAMAVTLIPAAAAAQTSPDRCPNTRYGYGSERTSR